MSVRNLDAASVIQQKDEGIWLHLEAGSDGELFVRDQHGRELKGIRKIGLLSALNSADELSLTVLCGVDGPSVFGRGSHG